jgi:hypothetical protein
MAHHIRNACAGVAAALLLMTPTPALAHGGDTSPGASPSASPDAHDMSGHDMSGHDMSGHDMSEMDGMDMPGDPSSGAHDHGTSGAHDHGTTSTDHSGHDQTGDTVSPQLRTLVLTGFGSVNGAVVVAAFLIRRKRPARTKGARR